MQVFFFISKQDSMFYSHTKCTEDYCAPVLLPGKSHGLRSLEGCTLWGREESDTTERLHFHFSLSCIEGNSNPLPCSCLENPRDGEAWWAAVYGVAQSRTWLKWLSSSREGETFMLEGGATYIPLCVLGKWAGLHTEPHHVPMGPRAGR